MLHCGCIREAEKGRCFKATNQESVGLIIVHISRTCSEHKEKLGKDHQIQF